MRRSFSTIDGWMPLVSSFSMNLPGPLWTTFRIRILITM